MYIFHVTKHPLGVTAMTGPKMSWPLGQILIGNLWSCDKAGAEFGRCRQCQLNVCGSITYKYIFGGVGWTSIFQQFQFSPGDLPWVTNSHGWCHARDRRGQRSFCTRKKLVVQGWTAWDSPVFIFFGWTCDEFAPKTRYPCIMISLVFRPVSIFIWWTSMDFLDWVWIEKNRSTKRWLRLKTGDDQH